ncbi:hypothetical protein [Kitasatospora cystarginea]|uniref:hypothetical protein n=1 Tax=Kitasatospora cystarginea TaxID=58350 RepID=UPI0031D5995E
MSRPPTAPGPSFDPNPYSYRQGGRHGRALPTAERHLLGPPHHTPPTRAARRPRAARALPAGGRPGAPDRHRRECERKAETQIRALLLQAFAASGLAPIALRAHREHGEVTAVRATVAVTGDVTSALEQVVSRLSLEPAVRDLHWHLEGGSAGADEEALA